ncbi:MAG: hypothetical protein WC619_05795 [Patescibacteria group bacterium]
MKKILSKIKYPKLLFLIFTFVAAYLMFIGRDFSPLHTFLLSLGYFGTFLAGIFFTYGFTAAPATAILLILAKEQNILFAGFIAGFGALIGDLIIFKFIRYSFADEIKKLSKEKAIHYLNNKTPNLLKKYFVPILAGFIIASPLPDEIGVSLLATSQSISTKSFSILCYILNTTGIFIILLIGSAI